MQVGVDASRSDTRIGLADQGIALAQVIDGDGEGVVGALLAGQYLDAGVAALLGGAAVAEVEDGGK